MKKADVVMKGWVELRASKQQRNQAFVCDAASSACKAPVRVLSYPSSPRHSTQGTAAGASGWRPRAAMQVKLR